MKRIKLTAAQQSALECSYASEYVLGTMLPDTEGEFAVAIAWDGGRTLTVQAHWQEALWSALVDMSNSEDEMAGRATDAESRRAARGACTALGNLAAKVLAIGFMDVDNATRLCEASSRYPPRRHPNPRPKEPAL